MAQVKTVLAPKSCAGCSPSKGTNIGYSVNVQEKNLEGSRGQGQGRGCQNLSPPLWIRTPWRACPRCTFPGPTSHSSSLRIQSDRDRDAHEPRGPVSRGAVAWRLLVASGRSPASAL